MPAHGNLPILFLWTRNSAVRFSTRVLEFNGVEYHDSDGWIEQYQYEDEDGEFSIRDVPRILKKSFPERASRLKSLDVVRLEELLLFASMLAVNPEAAVPSPGAIAIAMTVNGKRFRSLRFVREPKILQRGAMHGIANGRVDGDSFGCFVEKVRRNRNLQANSPFAARFQGEFLHLLADRGRTHVGTLGKNAGEARDEHDLSPVHEIGATERVP